MAATVLIGLTAGALAGRVVSGHGYGVLGDIVVGMARLLLHDPARSGSRGGDEARIPRQSEQPEDEERLPEPARALPMGPRLVVSLLLVLGPLSAPAQETGSTVLIRGSQ